MTNPTKTEQQKRFEAAFKAAHPTISHTFWLRDNGIGAYVEQATRTQFEGFQLGEASALERAALPEKFPPELIAKLRADPLTANGDDDEMHERIGWLVCAWPHIRALSQKEAQ